MTATRWESTNGRRSTCVLASQLVLGLGKVTAGLVPLASTTLYLIIPPVAVCQGSVNPRAYMKCFQVIVDLFGFTRLRQAHGSDHWSLLVLSMSRVLRFSLLLFLLSFVFPSYAVKFNLPAYRWPQKKCLWNPAHDNTLVIVTANISPGPGQQTDVEIVDSSPQKNVYLRKKGIKAETRLAITTHSEGEVGVCFYNYLEKGRYNITHTYDLCVLTLKQASLSLKPKINPERLTWTWTLVLTLSITSQWIPPGGMIQI